MANLQNYELDKWLLFSASKLGVVYYTEKLISTMMDVRQIEIVWRHCVKVIIYDVQCKEKQIPNIIANWKMSEGKEGSPKTKKLMRSIFG